MVVLQAYGGKRQATVSLRSRASASRTTLLIIWIKDAKVLVAAVVLRCSLHSPLSWEYGGGSNERMKSPKVDASSRAAKHSTGASVLSKDYEIRQTAK
jgi:hypothetical protein